MSKVYRRGQSPFWYADYVTPTGERIRRSTKCRDKSAATRIAREWERGAEHQAADELTGIALPSEITLIDLSTEFIDAVTLEKAAGYVAALEEHIKVRILPYFGTETMAAKITRQDVEGFRRALLSGIAPRNSGPKRNRPDGPMRAVTVNRHTVTLRRVLEYGVRQGYLRENAARNLPALRERTEPRHRALSDAELDALCGELAPVHERWVRFLVAVGLRDHEAECLRWEDVDFTHRIITVRASTAKDAETRRVPLTRGARDILDAMATELDIRKGPIFGALDRRQALLNAWKRTEQPGRTPSAHDFRHTFASRAVKAGLDLEELRQILGHKSVITSQKYIHLYGDRWAEAARKLDRL
jgi:integrase